MKTMKAFLFHNILSIFIVLCYGNDPYFNDESKLQLPQTYIIDWMNGLDDTKPLSDITIPGTHDTMSLYGGWAAECQAWSLSDQLKAGIRSLDLRLFELEGKLYAMHWVVFQDTTLTEILATVRAFLSEYKSETVLIRVKPVLIHKAEVQGLVEKLIKGATDVWVSSEIPTIGEVRGKIVFVQENSFKLGVPLMETDTKGDYVVTDVDNKESKIAKCLSEAITDVGGNSIILSYSSGTGIGTLRGMFLTPKRVAEKVNPWLNQHLRQYTTDHPNSNVCFGVIAMDFPGLDLIQTVISFNSFTDSWYNY